jgi:hypothetical protein
LLVILNRRIVLRPESTNPHRSSYWQAPTHSRSSRIPWTAWRQQAFLDGRNYRLHDINLCRIYSSHFCPNNSCQGVHIVSKLLKPRKKNNYKIPASSPETVKLSKTWNYIPLNPRRNEDESDNNLLLPIAFHRHVYLLRRKEGSVWINSMEGPGIYGGSDEGDKFNFFSLIGILL